MKRSGKKTQDHSECPCWILQRGPHWGLFCRPHGAYIKWLNASERQQLSEWPELWQKNNTESSVAQTQQ